HEDHREAIRAYQETNMGLPRRIQILHVHREILGRDVSEAELEGLCARYGDLVTERVLRAPFVAGAREFLEAHHKICPLYLASATPEEELRQIAGARGIEGYFQEIFGAPRPKADILREIQKTEGLGPGEMVFVGDALSDMEAAREANVPFVARLGESGGLEDAPRRIRDLRELPALLERLFAP
ncbi:MAG: HAD family hydrolase, partial [bacterium]